jgi:lipopolysaccharide transport system permease protein
MIEKLQDIGTQMQLSDPIVDTPILSHRQGKKIIIQPSHGWVALKLGEVWQYRELLFFLTWRDIKIRYKQTLLGAAWALIQPFMTMIVFSLFFGRLAKVPSDGIPYPIFAYAALIPWTYFANGVALSANSMLNDTNLIKKVYFPRLIMPIATVCSGLPDFCLAFLILLAMMVVYGLHPTAISIIWLPICLALTMITALGIGFWLSALNVEYRDIRYTVPFIVQLWLFATPVAYPSSLLTEPWQTLYGLNPMVGVVEGFRWALLGSGHPPGPMVFLSALASIVVLVSGAYYFRRIEKTFADIV